MWRDTVLDVANGYAIDKDSKFRGKHVEIEILVPVGKQIRFDESVQKKLNDSLVGDKGMVDAINNSFMSKFNKNLKADAELSSRIEGQYQDFKSLRLRLKLRPGDNAAEFEKKLSSLYAKSNKEFVEEFEKGGLTKLIPPRTDEVVDVSTWFL